jgi:soluble lytic murein transglycosylase-like protein
MTSEQTTLLINAKVKLLIIEAAINNKIDQQFLFALIKTESSFNPNAERYEKNYKYLYAVKELAELIKCSKDTMENAQKRSYGLGQIMGAVAYERGFRGWPADLYNPEINLDYTCRHILWLVDRFQLKFDGDLYAAYNAGIPPKVQGDRYGKFHNESTVKKFLTNYEEVGKYMEVKF